MTGSRDTRTRRTGLRLECLERRSLLAAITEYPLPTGAGTPNQIVEGPDGNMWFVDQSNKIGMITPAGSITEFKIPFNGSPWGITVGPDKALWFTESSGVIGRVTTSGQFSSFPIDPTGKNTNQNPEGIVSGPDGALWFAENGDGKIGRMTTSGQVTEYAVPHGNPVDIAVGPDGALWYTEDLGSYLGRVTTSGSVSDYDLMKDDEQLVTGPDNNLWVALPFDSLVDQVSVSGGTVSNVNTYTDSHGKNPWGIISGPGSNLFFTERSGSAIGMMTTTGVLTEYPITEANAQPNYLAQGPSNTVWFTDEGNKSIGVLSGLAIATPTPTPTPTTTPTPIGTPTPTTPTPTPTTTLTPTPTPTSTTTLTPTPTASAPQGYAAPRINTAVEIHKRGRTYAIRLIFQPRDPATDLPSDPLDVADATNVNNYQVMALIQEKRPAHAIIVQPVALASATYGHATLPASATYGPFEEVTLTLTEPVPQKDRLQLTVLSSPSGIVGIHGMPLNGTGDEQQPGGNYVAYL